MVVDTKDLYELGSSQGLRDILSIKGKYHEIGLAICVLLGMIIGTPFVRVERTYGITLLMSLPPL
jgi:hypothetical protein